MKIMNRILKLFLIAAVGTVLVGCYNDYDNPAPAKVYTAADFPEGKYKNISIKDFKQLFYNEYGTSSSGLAKFVEITDNYVISGKVISSDRAGNVYKSLYIYDERSESAIELRLNVSNYVFYHPGQTIFVKTKGLVIGNYRYMLSVGRFPSDANIADGYANSNLENPNTISQYICPGALGKLTGADTLVVNASNYATLNDDDLGRLIRFEGLTYKTGTYEGDKFPNYLETLYPGGSSVAVYTTKFYEDEGLTPTYAYNYNNQKYYGSSWFSFGPTSGTSGSYIVRVSGYANFGLTPLPAAGTTGEMTAIYTKYSSKSGGFIKYQLLVNSGDDIRF